VNAAPEARPEALAAFVAEVQPWVASRRFLPEPAKGVAATDLEPLRSVDPRPAAYWTDTPTLLSAGITAAADLAVGGLDGRTVAIEGFDATGLAVANEVVSRGARVVAIGTAAGTAIDERGLDAATVAAAWQAHGPDLVRELEPEPGPAGAVLGTTADVLVVGSRAGILDHGVAAGCGARAVVPSGPIPVTAKGLAVLRRAGVTVLPDFVTTAGPMLGGLAPVLDGDGASAVPASVVGDRVQSALRDVLDHEQGPVAGRLSSGRRRSCGSWRDELPFGRPLA